MVCNTGCWGSLTFKDVDVCLKKNHWRCSLEADSGVSWCLLFLVIVVSCRNAFVFACAPIGRESFLFLKVTPFLDVVLFPSITMF